MTWEVPCQLFNLLLLKKRISREERWRGEKEGGLDISRSMVEERGHLSHRVAESFWGGRVNTVKVS